jgi:hypothetical protein
VAWFQPVTTVATHRQISVHVPRRGMRARACLRSPAQPSPDAHFSTSFSPTIQAKQVDGSGAAAAHDGDASSRGVRPVAATPGLFCAPVAVRLSAATSRP